MTNYSLEWIVNQILYWLDPYWNFSTNEEKITELLFFAAFACFGIVVLGHLIVLFFKPCQTPD
jgi:hypothetical protein